MERKSGFQIMKRLIVELRPLVFIMSITITLGVLGFLAAISIASFSVLAIGSYIGDVSFITFKSAVIIMIVCAISRGFLRYGEQLSGHYIAFKILYILRDKIFLKLRKLAPAKLEGEEKGELISIITSDIELLEVFYAHTIAPIAIAIITNSIISVILYMINPVFGILAAIFFIIVGFVIPYFSSNFAKKAGSDYRNMFGECNNYILDSLRGLKELLQFKNGQERLKEINHKSRKMNKSLDVIKEHEGKIRAVTDLTIMMAILTFVGVGFYMYETNSITFTAMVLAIVILASSFGPVVALSNLSNTLLQTFACAQRLFDLIDEKPLVNDVISDKNHTLDSINYQNVDFTYPQRTEKVFDHSFINIEKGEKIALVGKSGIGKSTFVKLLMRFWDVDGGSVNLGGENIKNISTKNLRKTQILVGQETYLFNESILENIKIGNKNATRKDVEEAAKKASIHEFIKSLPKGYDTSVGELGSNLSSGEKQRIGLARAFVSEGDMLILDEPTSNLDTLNESEILKAIKENCEDKTIVLITHRKSTTNICNKVYKLENKKILPSY